MNRWDENYALVFVAPHSKNSYIRIKMRSNRINRIHKSHFWPKKSRVFLFMFACNTFIGLSWSLSTQYQQHFKQPNFHKIKREKKTSSITMIQFFSIFRNWCIPYNWTAASLVQEYVLLFPLYLLCKTDQWWPYAHASLCTIIVNLVFTLKSSETEIKQENITECTDE